MKTETRGRPTKITPKIFEQIRKLRKEYTVFQIAPKIGLSRQTIFRALSGLPESEKNEWFIGNHSGRGSRYKFTEETIETLHELVKQGHSVMGIAQHLQVSRKSISLALKKAKEKQTEFLTPKDIT